MKNEKEERKEENACKFANLHNLFDYLDWQIRHHKSDSGSKKGLLEKREKLSRVVKEIDLCDLEILYYVRHIDGLWKTKLRKMLKEYYEAQRRFKEDLKNCIAGKSEET